MSSLNTPLHTSMIRRGAIGLAAVATFTLAACGNGATAAGGSSSSAASSSAPVLSSADPAASSAVAPSTSAMSSMEMSATTGGTSSSGAATGGSTAATTTHNDADVMFLQMMLPHHRGAIEMAQLAPSRAANAQVKELAAQIEAAQAPEIEQMTSWLQAWGMPVDPAATSMSSAPSSDGGMSGMDHGGMTMGKDGDMAMPGEMSAEQMTALQNATGAEFDRMFLELMIEHHSGAVDMAKTELDAGANPDALALAESIQSSQTQEIATMQQLLQTL